MGQSNSKTKSRGAHQSANASQYSLHQTISDPEPPRRLTHISELIEIDQLIGNSPTDTLNTLLTQDLPVDNEPPPVMIQSPSGNILSTQQYMERPDRVMTLEERKNLIRSNTERHIRVHESGEGLRTEALRTGALRVEHSDEARDKKSVFVVARKPVSQPLAEKETLSPKRARTKRRLGCLIFCWSR